MNNKDDARPSRKIVDVAGPGKSAPSASSRPIIVTNRPMMRRDPMVAPLNSVDTSAGHTSPILRAAKTIKVSTVEPVEDKPDIALESDSKPDTVRHDEQEVAIEVGQEALAGVSGKLPGKANDDENDDKETVSDEDIAPDIAPEIQESVSEVAEKEEESGEKAQDKVPDAEPVAAASEKEADQTTSEEEPSPDETSAAPKAEQPVEEAQMPKTSDSLPAAEPKDDGTDQQLPPNQVLEEAKRKEEEAALARQVEMEKIIQSKQYYLPIAAPSHHQGTRRAVVALVLVLLLTAAWFDIVLDAGIVHIVGVQSLTHFFGQ
jgi:hypothetical protein